MKKVLVIFVAVVVLCSWCEAKKSTLQKVDKSLKPNTNGSGQQSKKPKTPTTGGNQQSTKPKTGNQQVKRPGKSLSSKHKYADFCPPNAFNEKAKPYVWKSSQNPPELRFCSLFRKFDSLKDCEKHNDEVLRNKKSDWILCCMHYVTDKDPKTVKWCGRPMQCKSTKDAYRMENPGYNRGNDKFVRNQVACRGAVCKPEGKEARCCAFDYVNSRGGNCHRDGCVKTSSKNRQCYKAKTPFDK